MTEGEQKDDRRHDRDRRTTPRGGRRPGDPMGYSPLVLVADDDADSGARCVAILARLRFAVAPAHSVDEAVRVMQALRPNLVVARLRDEPELKKRMDQDPNISDIPLVTLTPENDAPQLLIEEIRKALRRR
jgi:PleD family two-component response regulator